MASETSASPAISNQKKRALEALEQRFAVDHIAETPRQHCKGKGKGARHKAKGVEEEGRLEGEAVVLATLESGTSSKRGHFAFNGQTSRQGNSGVSDEEAQCAAYFELSQPIDESLLKPNKLLSSKGASVVDKIVHDLLQNGDEAQKYMQGSTNVKIDNSLLLDNVVPRHGAATRARVKAMQNHSKRSKRHMSMRQHQKCGSFDFPQNFHKFELFKPMHEMWKDYILELIKDIGRSQLAQCLLKADLHGAILLVVECKITALTGTSGIMVRETAETFGVIMQDDEFRVVPKKGSVFIFQAGCWKITLYGDKLSSRNLGRWI